MSMYVVDVEADGPIPGDYSMLWIGAVRLDRELQTRFSIKLRPLENAGFKAEALNAAGLDREEFIRDGTAPLQAMTSFRNWIAATNRKGRPVFLSDNNAFDWMFVCWYFHHFLHENPFGYSSRRIGDFYAGLRRDYRARWKHLRKTLHTHNPVDDAVGNAEAFIAMLDEGGIDGLW